MNKPILVVLAAGMGSRYGGLKQIDPVGPDGEAILDYSLFDARRAGFDTVVFIIKHEIEKDFKDTVGRRVMKSGMEIRYSFQQLEKLPEGYCPPEGRVKPWGTAHAVLCAAAEIDAPFAVINADDYYGPEAFAAAYHFLSAAEGGELPYRFGMVGFALKNTLSENGSVSRGVCEVDSRNYLLSVTEHTSIRPVGAEIISEFNGEKLVLDGETPVSMNLWCFTPAFCTETANRFPAFLDQALASNPLKGEFYLPTVVSALLQEKKATVQVLKSSDKWFGITYQQDKPLLCEAIAQKTADGLYPVPLWK